MNGFFLSCFELHVALRVVTGRDKGMGKEGVSAKMSHWKNCDEYFIEDHWRETTTCNQ